MIAVISVVTVNLLTGAPAKGWDLKEDKVVQVQPAPGRPTAPPTKPSWCAGMDEGPKNKNPVLVKQYMAAQDKWVDAAKLLCENPDSPTVQKQTGYLLQQFINQFDLSVQEAIEDVTVSTHWQSQHDQDFSNACKALVSADNKTLAQRANDTLIATAYNCEEVKGDSAWAATREPSIAHPLAQVGYLSMCLSSDLENDSLKIPLADDFVLGYINCLAMVPAVDKSVVLAQLEKDNAPAGVRTSVLERLSVVKHRLINGEALYNLRAGNNAVLKTIRAAAEKRSAEWKKEFAQNESALRTAFALDDALSSDSKSTRAACDAGPAQQAFETMVKSAHLTSLDDVTEFMNKAAPAMVAQRVRDCLAQKSASSEALPWVWITNRVGVTRDGTFSEVRLAMLEEIGTILADRPNAFQNTLSFGYESQRPTFDLPHYSETAEPSKVKAIGKGSEVVTASFVPELMDSVECVTWKETNRIDRIENGKLVYRQVCTKSKPIKVNLAPAPLKVAAKESKVLTPGTYARVLRIDGDNTGASLATFSDKTGKKLVSLLGFPVR